MATDLGVDTPWAVTATTASEATGPLRTADLDAALAWCAGHAAGRAWSAVASGRDLSTHQLLWERGLVERDALPVLAITAGASSLRFSSGSGPLADRPAGVHLDLCPDWAAVVAGYGGWMQDEPLAAALVHPHDLAHPARRFVVARAGGDVVGAALVWLPGTTVHLSGLGVVPGWRGRGVGRALVVAAARLGLQAAPQADAVWMHASDEGLPLYVRLGFTGVDEHRRLGPPAG